MGVGEQQGAGLRQPRLAAVTGEERLPDLGFELVDRRVERRERDAELLRSAGKVQLLGGDDEPVIELNEWALARLGSPVKELRIIPGASHLFEEPGKLDEVARLAADWFTRHFNPAG